MKGYTYHLLSKLYREVDLPIERITEAEAIVERKMRDDCFSVTQGNLDSYYRFLKDNEIEAFMPELDLQMKLRSYKRTKTITTCVVIMTILAVVASVIGIYILFNGITLQATGTINFW